MSRTKRKPVDPRRRMGVYKTLAEVPARRQLDQYAGSYRERDVWAEYFEARLSDYEGVNFVEYTERVEQSWKDHMTERGRHHALATPDDVETWAEMLLDEFSVRYATDPYWTRIQHFYDWLEWHADHPHTYNPFLMAAAQFPAAGRIWDEKTAHSKWRVGGE